MFQMDVPSPETIAAYASAAGGVAVIGGAAWRFGRRGLTTSVEVPQRLSKGREVAAKTNQALEPVRQVAPGALGAKLGPFDYWHLGETKDPCHVVHHQMRYMRKEFLEHLWSGVKGVRPIVQSAAQILVGNVDRQCPALADSFVRYQARATRDPQVRHRYHQVRRLARQGRDRPVLIRQLARLNRRLNKKQLREDPQAVCAVSGDCQLLLDRLYVLAWDDARDGEGADDQHLAFISGTYIRTAVVKIPRQTLTSGAAIDRFSYWAERHLNAGAHEITVWTIAASDELGSFEAQLTARIKDERNGAGEGKVVFMGKAPEPVYAPSDRRQETPLYYHCVVVAYGVAA